VSVFYYYSIKCWQEILTIFGFVRLLISKKKLGWPVFFILSLAIHGLFVGIIQGTNFFEIFRGFRMYLLFICGLFLLFYSDYFKRINLRLIFTVFIGFTTFSALYSVWVDYLYMGDLKVLWFYNFVNQINPIESARFNYVRDGGLRACGLLISPLIQSLLLGFSTLILTLLTFKNPERRNPAWNFILLTIQIIGLILCRTRIGWFVVGGGLVLAFAHLYCHRLSLYQSYLVPIVLVLMTLFILLFGYTTDPSALGRIPQYKLLFLNFNWVGLGFGHPSTLTVFDSMYISAGLTFGVLGLLYIMIPVMACAILHDQRKNYLDHTKPDSFYFAASYGFSFILLYVFAFQFTLGSPTVLLFYFLVYSFSVESKFRVHSKPNE